MAGRSARTSIKSSQARIEVAQRQSRIRETGDAYGRYKHLQLAHRARAGAQVQRSIDSGRQIETQNLRGFRVETRATWLAAWRRTPEADRPLAWLVQETHVSSNDEAALLADTWTRLWGRQHQPQGPALSYWSVDESKTGGVAILLPPATADRVHPWRPEHWTNRVIAVDFDVYRLVNIYAPNQQHAREEFFSNLQQWPWQQREVILAGDFNSVQSPPLDRLGGQRSGRPESAALHALVQQLHLEDARTLMDPVEDADEAPDPTEFFTYWGSDSASRIDRFYVHQSWAHDVQWVSVDEPQVPSDHHRVRLHLRPNVPATQSRRRKRPVMYPIKTAQSARVLAELLDELISAEVGKTETAATWDNTAKKCVACVQRIKKRETQRRNAVIHRIHAQNRARILTRSELLEVTVEEAREEHLVRLGQRLHRTTEQLRWTFKRVSNWESDQTITDIRQTNGAPFRREMMLADRFASEWKPILGVVHHTTPSARMVTEFDQFVQIPANRRLSAANNVLLLQEISPDEVIQAIDALNRHKAAGADGLNNDFFKDTQAVMVPAMVAIGNELLAGGEPPKSFLQGLIIPGTAH